MRHADSRGTAVRVQPRPSVDTLSKEERKQRISLLTSAPALDFAKPLYFTFQSQSKWKHPSDIVILEANAYLLEMRAFLKQSHSENLGARVLHVFDAASALGGMAKGRSSSKRLNRLCSKAGALSFRCHADGFAQ